MYQSRNFISRLFAAAIVIFLFTLVGCKEDDPKPSNNPNFEINNWIKETMDVYYLWNTQLPSSPNKELAPDAFFESLLVNEDRFSWIQDNYQELINSLEGITKEGGYEFALYLEAPGSSNVIAQVVYVKPSSPASGVGLKRGDVITYINDQQITTANYQSLLRNSIRENHTIRYRVLDIEKESFGSTVTAAINTVQYSENPNFLNKVITVDDHKIGYYVYNFFSKGTSTSPEQYDLEMKGIFETFKNQGITDLVLDLRFNGGGSESAAVSLASLIGKGTDKTKTFAKKKYNSILEDAFIKQYGSGSLQTMFTEEPFNIGNILNNGRVYVLTSSRTASASELIINSLRPFMDVFLIGDITYGKNVGSVSLEDKTNKNNNWGMQPIVVKVFNGIDQSDYSTGFVPNIERLDNSLYLYPLGDEREALLSTAIAEITGTSSLGRQGVKESRERIGHSIDLHRRSFVLNIDQPLPIQ